MIKLKSLGVLLLGFISSPTHASVSYKNQIIQEIRITAANIANANTTRTPDGGPYKKKHIYCSSSGCVINEESVFRSIHEPGHIDADARGMVLYPDINVAEEMDHMIQLQEDYESH